MRTDPGEAMHRRTRAALAARSVARAVGVRVLGTCARTAMRASMCRNTLCLSVHLQHKFFRIDLTFRMHGSFQGELSHVADACVYFDKNGTHLQMHRRGC